MADLDSTRIRQQSRKHCTALAAHKVQYTDHNVIQVEFGRPRQQTLLMKMSDVELKASVIGGYGSLSGSVPQAEVVPGWDQLENVR